MLHSFMNCIFNIGGNKSSALIIKIRWILSFYGNIGDLFTGRSASERASDLVERLSH